MGLNILQIVCMYEIINSCPESICKNYPYLEKNISSISPRSLWKEVTEIKKIRCSKSLHTEEKLSYIILLIRIFTGWSEHMEVVEFSFKLFI